MNILISFLTKLATSLLTKLGSYLVNIYNLMRSISKRNKEIDVQTEVHKKNVENAIKDGVITKDEEEELRKSNRDIIRDSFH